MRVIDYIANLELSDEQEKGHSNELRSLSCLATGLTFLYEQVRRVEGEVIEGLPKNKQVIISGNARELQRVNQELVACAFQWYAVTACNYVKMVGWLANNGESSKARKDMAREYMRGVLPQVHLWRNKVAAHFAIVDPRGDDNAADRAMSVMFRIGFVSDAFYTDPFTLTIRRGGKQSTSRQDMRWSLTHTHCDLMDRYWREDAPKK